MLSKILNTLKNSDVWRDIHTILFTCATSKEANILKGTALVGAIVTIFVSMLVPDEHFWRTIYSLVSITLVVIAFMKVFGRGDEQGGYALLLVIIVGSTLFFGWSGFVNGLAISLILFTIIKCGDYYFDPAKKVIGKNNGDNYSGFSIIPALVAGGITWFVKDFITASVITSVMVIALAYALQYLYMDAKQLEKLAEQREKLKQEKSNKAEPA